LAEVPPMTATRFRVSGFSFSTPRPAPAHDVFDWSEHDITSPELIQRGSGLPAGWKSKNAIGNKRNPFDGRILQHRYPRCIGERSAASSDSAKGTASVRPTPSRVPASRARDLARTSFHRYRIAGLGGP
jgi:hypothetical protein